MTTQRMGTKRKYASSDALKLALYRPYARPKTVYKKRRTGSSSFIPGVDRTGGYYGRYSGRDGELKFHDVDLDDAVVAIGGNVTPTINIIAQGVTESTRVGRKCTIKSMNWNWIIRLPESDAQATPAGGDSIRIIVYLDKQCNGAAASATDLLETDDFQSYRNLANSGRFVFLMDKMITLNYQGMASDGAGVVSQANFAKTGVFFKKCDIPIEYDNSASDGTLATIRTNNLGVMIVGLSGTMTFFSKIRLRFSDK